MQLIFVLPSEHVSIHMRNKVKKVFRQNDIDVTCTYQSPDIFFKESTLGMGEELIYCISFQRHYFVTLIQWMERQRQVGFKGKILMTMEPSTFDYEIIPKFVAGGGDYILSSNRWQEDPSILLREGHCTEVDAWLYNQQHHQNLHVYNDDALSFLYQQLVEEERVSLPSVAYIYEALDEKHKKDFLSYVKAKTTVLNRRVHVTKQNVFKGEGLLTVWDNPEFASELAVQMAKKTKKKVLLIDLDRLNPRIDFYCGQSTSINQGTSGDLMNIQKIYASNNGSHEYDQVCVGHRDVPTLRVLYGCSDLKQFEYFTNEALLDGLSYYRKRYDVVIANVNAFIYDAYTCLALITSDLNLFPIDGSLASIRHCQRSMRFLEEKQKLSVEKCAYILFDYSELDKHHMKLLSEIVGVTIIGQIESCKKREDYRNIKKSYAKHMAPKIVKDYERLLKVLKVVGI